MSYSHEWKDGCPPAPDPKRGAFGFSADPDASLGPTRIALVGRRTNAVPVDASSAPTGWIMPLDGYLQLNHIKGPTLSLRYGGLWSPNAEELQRADNFGAAIGYRLDRFALGEAIRVAGSLRLGEGISLTAEDRHTDALTKTTIRFPFEASAVAFDRPITATFELRGEMIGCHSPFAHLRIEASQWRSDRVGEHHPSRNDRSVTYAIPMSLAVGGYVAQNWGIAAQFGIEFRGPSDVLEADFIMRTRLAVEYRGLSYLHFMVFASAYSADYRGVEYGVAFYVPYQEGVFE